MHIRENVCLIPYNEGYCISLGKIRRQKESVSLISSKQESRVILNVCRKSYGDHLERQVWHVAIKSDIAREKMSPDLCYWRTAEADSPSTAGKEKGMLSAPWLGHAPPRSGPSSPVLSAGPSLTWTASPTRTSTLVLPSGLHWTITSLQKCFHQ